MSTVRDTNRPEGQHDSATRQGSGPSRREIAAGAAGVVAGIVGGSAFRAGPVAAADGDPVRLGRTNTADSLTTIRNRTAGGTALRLAAHGRTSVALLASSPNVAVYADGGTNGVGVNGASVFGGGVYGQSLFDVGVTGTSDTGFGVQGDSRESTGVLGNSRYGSGLAGGNLAADHPAVSGWAQGGGTGVRGVSAGPDAEIPAYPDTGVHGWCDATAGVGVLAQSPGGTALRVDGRAEFSRSGVAVVPAGEDAVTVAQPGLSSVSLVFAQLRRHQRGLHVEAAVVDVDRGRFTVHLSHTVAAATPLSWFVVG